MDNLSKPSDSSLSSTSTSTAATSTTAPAGTSTTTTRDHYLRHLHKISHKISKPSVVTALKKPLFDPPQQPPLDVPPPPQQPPVYNISKSDFRDVVQKLTGSPAHERMAAGGATPPINAPKPPSSRLQRIRPPPLAQLSNRPPSLLNQNQNPFSAPAVANPSGFMRPLSPLPPLPTCHAAAESPISAYMRFFHSSMQSVDHDPKTLPPPMVPPPPPHMFTMPPPSSPLPFGCLPSPKSPCPLLSPNLLFSPKETGLLGFPQLPVSPTVPGVPSPK